MNTLDRYLALAAGRATLLVLVVVPIVFRLIF